MTCKFGFWGDDCLVCDGYSAGVPCHGHGKCNDKDGSCECDKGFSDKHGCSDCVDGYYGDNCLECPGVIIKKNKTLACDGHGYCTNTGE